MSRHKQRLSARAVLNNIPWQREDPRVLWNNPQPTTHNPSQILGKCPVAQARLGLVVEIAEPGEEATKDSSTAGEWPEQLATQIAGVCVCLSLSGLA